MKIKTLIRNLGVVFPKLYVVLSLVIVSLILAFILTWRPNVKSRAVAEGPLANSSGLKANFSCSGDLMLNVISNRFDSLDYYGMLLVKVQPGVWDYLAPGWHPTNGFILYPDHAISNISLSNGQRVPYIPIFYIGLQQLTGLNQVQVTIRTLDAEIADGVEQGVHGGLAAHTRKVTPVAVEEERLLAAISKALENRGKEIRSLGK